MYWVLFPEDFFHRNLLVVACLSTKKLARPHVLGVFFSRTSSSGKGSEMRKSATGVTVYQLKNKFCFIKLDVLTQTSL